MDLILEAAAAAAAFLFLTVGVFADSPVLKRIDAALEKIISPMKTRRWSAFWTGITYFGGLWGIILVSFIALFASNFDPVFIIRGIAAVAGVSAVVQALKMLVARARPEKLPWRDHELEFSYPSGHTAAATALYGLLAVVFAVPAGILWLCAAILAILLIAFSRMALSVHYASDILGGLLLGVLGLLAAFTLPL